MAVELFPLLSVTVKTTALGPTSAQVKLATSKLNSSIPQASKEPLSISAGTILTVPEASSCTVISCARATGEIVSKTVIAEYAMLEFPFTSVTVKATVFELVPGPSGAVSVLQF